MLQVFHRERFNESLFYVFFHSISTFALTDQISNASFWLKWFINGYHFLEDKFQTRRKNFLQIPTLLTDRWFKALSIPPSGPWWAGPDQDSTRCRFTSAATGRSLRPRRRRAERRRKRPREAPRLPRLVPLLMEARHDHPDTLVHLRW